MDEQTPNRWLAWASGLAGPACFLAFAWILNVLRTQVMPVTAYAADDVYLNLAAARTLLHHGELGLVSGSPMPATVDVLWQFIVSMGLRFLPDPQAVSLVLGALAGLLAVGGTLALARTWNGIRGAVPAACLMALSSSLPVAVMGGQSVALSMLLSVYLVHRYLEGGPKSCWPLSPRVAWWAGLAALVHVELLVIWLAVVGHAVLTGPWRHGRGHGLAFPLVRWVGHVLIIAMVLSPALAWNLHALGVPWPRFPDAPLSLDAWSMQAPADVLAASWNLSSGVWRECYARAFQVPVLGGLLPPLFLLLGLVFSVVDAARDRQQLTGTVGLALLLVPALYALAYPYVGWNAAPAVFASLQSAWAVVMARGVYRCTALLCGWVGTRSGRTWAWLSPGWAAAVLITIMALMGVLRNLQAGRAQVHQAAQIQQERQRVMDPLGPADSGGAVASDRPGWLAFTRPARYLDLTGRATPVILAFRDMSGWQGDAAADFLRQQGVTRLVIWSEPYAYAAGPLGAVMDGTWPKVVEVR